MYLTDYMKKRSITNSETTRDIIYKNIKDLNTSNIIKMPKYKSIQNMINKERKKNFIFYNDEESDIHESLKFTNKKEKFYLFDSGIYNSNRAICFTTENNLLHLSQCEIWIADGTFKSCPSLFYQFYTIIGVVKNKTFLLCYFLMKTKSKKSYDDAFNFLKSKVTKHPKIIIIDFEQAAYLSFHQIFPSSNLKGCFFHLTQSI
ncbi:hypothetical protein DMUE_1117 [Dictyocoela muelleri]|nr:hypothetical protein DMUE_1117 [Dictyocoela muelleri]